MKKVEVICPLFNGKSFVDTLVSSILKQKEIDIKKPYYLLSEMTERVRSPIYRVSRGLSGNGSSGQNYPRGLTDDSMVVPSMFIQ